MLIHTFRDAESESTKSCVYGDVTTVSDVSLHRRIHRGLEGVRTPPPPIFGPGGPYFSSPYEYSSDEEAVSAL